jgi:hypothetical protein
MKKEFCDKIYKLFNIRLENDSNNPLNDKRNILYTKIDRKHKNTLLFYILEAGYRFESHFNDYYWIYL